MNFSCDARFIHGLGLFGKRWIFTQEKGEEEEEGEVSDSLVHNFITISWFYAHVCLDFPDIFFPLPLSFFGVALH